MSGYANISAVGDPNILYKGISGAGLIENQANQLLNLHNQQVLGGNEIEMMARAAASLQALPTTEARAAAYPGRVAWLQSQGFAKNAPATYPGDAQIAAIAQMGTPSADLFKYQQGQKALDAVYPSTPSTSSTATGGGVGGGGATGGGARALTGDLETDRKIIAQRESGGDPKALNYVAVADPTAYGRGATASGKYQFVNSTWREGLQLAGLDPAQYPTAMSAPESVQDKVFTAVYGKYGTKPWDPSTYGQAWVPAPGGRMVLVKGAASPATTAAAPGSPPAASAPAPGVQVGGAPPPPPQGAPGPYTGGGFGAAVVGQPPAARAAPIPAGRPTGPPVITDQPAGSNVVAGPPGVATVGQPVPPSPAVAGNVDAINAGIVRAGGTPATDPYATPARYAGTAPAPSVEAAPQAGWGTGIGVYGPQNALAPSPAVPAAPAQPAATPTAPAAPAATAQPAAQPAAGAPPGMDENYLTPQDHQALQRMKAALAATGNPQGPQLLQAEIDRRANFNVQRQKDFLAAQHQAMEDARQQEADRRAAAEAARQEQANTRAEEDAARKRAVDADPIKGTDDKANADRLLLKYVDKVLDGTATPAERRLYAEAAQYYLKPQMQWVDDPTDPTKKQMVAAPGQLPEGFPHPNFKPGGAQPPSAPPAATKTDFKPLPEIERKQLIDTATRIDQETQQRNTFKPEYAGFGNAAIGEFANAVARNNPIASKADTARAEWWQNYQRYKLAVRQGVSGQSLTASELGEFDKADIHPGMTAQAVRDNLLQQDKILRTAHERRVGSLAADRYSPDAIMAASGVDPTKVTAQPLTEGNAQKPDTAPHPPGFKVIIP